MAQEVRQFAVTVAAGSTPSAPVITPLTMPAREVRSIRVRIPPGPNGQVGFALGAAGTPIIPTNTGQWIIANDETIIWPVSDQIDSGAWQLIAYNTGRRPHTLYIEFQLDLVQARRGTSLAPPLVITA
jgi:hypothetical protein